jgi:hypothetical protein
MGHLVACGILCTRIFQFTEHLLIQLISTGYIIMPDIQYIRPDEDLNHLNCNK